MGRIPVNGFTLIELLTVIALMTVMSTWFYSATREAQKDYQIRAVIEQAQESLRLVEIMRKSGTSLVVSEDDQSAVLAKVATLTGADEFGELLSPLVTVMEPMAFPDDVPAGKPTFSIAGQRSYAKVRFTSNDVASMSIPFSEKSPVDSEGKLTFTLFARDSDPLIHAYTADALYMRRRVGE